MAKVETNANAISVSGLTIWETDEGNVMWKAKAGTKLVIQDKPSSESIRLVVNKTAKYVLSDRTLFTGDGQSASLFGSAADFDATDYSKLKTINASVVSGEVALTGNKNANLLIAGNNGSTLDGGAGNDTLTGGKGADLFIYQSGNDVIKGFSATGNEADDEIQIEDASVTDGSVSGNNVVLKIGKNTLTVEGMAKKDLTFTDADGTKIFKDGIFYNEDKTSATLASSFSKSGQVKFSSSVIDIDASNVKKAVYLVGNGEDNNILGGSGNDSIDGGNGADTLEGSAGNDKLWGKAGDDVLIGGKGNDSLWGGEGSNEFIYAKGDGKDVIFGFTSDDTLTLDDIDFTSATVSKNGTEVTLKLGSGSVTFKEFASDTEFNINGSTYQVVKEGNKYSFEEA